MDIIAPSNSGLIQAIKKTDWSDRASYAKLFGKLYYVLSNPVNLLDLEWDYLFVLDAARRDLFDAALTDIAPGLVSETETITTVASTTIEWGYRTFRNRDETQYGYVSANPNVNWFDDYLDRELEFDPLVDVTRAAFSPVLGVPPRVMSDYVLDHVSKRPNHAWICHYEQPHAPFIAPDIDHPDLPRSAYDESPNVWEYLAAGEIDREAVREAYLANHRFVLREVLWLLGELPPNKTVLVTSDHGNGMGGLAGYYGHGEGVYLPDLLRVPALRVETGESLANRPENVEPPTDATISVSQNGVVGSVNDRLETLGYID